MRGHQKLTALFPLAYEANPDHKNAGRLYTSKRDALIVYRFYFYHQLRKVRFDEALVDMELEFFLSPDYISRRINLNVEELKRVIDEAPTTTELKRKYPHLNWN